MDRHRFDTDLDQDPTFHFDVDRNLHRHQNNTVPIRIRILPQGFTEVGKLGKFCYFYLQFFFSHQWLMCQDFTHSGQKFMCLQFIPNRIRQNDADPTRSRSGSTTTG